MTANTPDSTASRLVVRPLPNARFGAEISGLDPRNITPEDEAVIWQAYRERHGLICFEFDHLIEADELHALTSVFGQNEVGPGKINGIGKGTPEGEEALSVEEQIARLQAQGDDPYLLYIGNVNPKTLELKPVDEKFFGEWEWHTDMSYIEVPPTFSLLHAREIPEGEGDTGFCSQVMAAKALSPARRDRLLGLRVKHDSTYGSSGIPRPGMAIPESPVEAVGHPHPVLRVVPTTGEDAMFLGRRTNAYVMGMELDESEALLDELWSHSTQPDFCYRHHWKVGQVVVWDNRMMLHMRHPFDIEKRRLMWRTQTKGEAVVPAS